MSHHKSAANLLPNPSFEEVTDGIPAEWEIHAHRPEIAPCVTSDDRVARTGNRSLRMSGGEKEGVVGWMTARGSGIQAGNHYRVVAYFRAENVPDLHESAWAAVSWLRDESDDFPRVALLCALAREGKWWRLSELLQAPDEAHLAEISLGFRYAPGGQIWWDDVSLQETPSPTPRRARLATAYLPEDQRNPEGWGRVIRQAGEAHADAVCLGEMAEIVPKDPDARPSIPGPATDALAEHARQYRMMIVVSLPEWEGHLRYNTAVIIGRDGQIVGRYRKTHLPQAEVKLDGHTPGSSLPVFDTEIGRVGLQVCYDHFFPEVARLLALQGAEIIFTPIMGGGSATANQALARAPAIDNSVVMVPTKRGHGGGRRRPSAAAPRARAIDNSVFWVTSIRDSGGRSLIVDPSGRILADSAGQPGVVFADVDLDAPHYERWLSVEGEAEFRHLWPKERRPSIYRALAQGQSADASRPRDRD